MIPNIPKEVFKYMTLRNLVAVFLFIPIINMNIYLYLIIGLLMGVPTGVVIGRYLLRKLFKDQEIAAQNKVKKILKDAENDSEILKKNKLLEAKERFLQMKAEHEQQINEKNN